MTKKKQALHAQEANLRQNQILQKICIRFKEIFQQYPVTINQVKTKRKGNDCQQGHISFFLYFLQSMGNDMPM
jgi:hypothetical protein